MLRLTGFMDHLRKFPATQISRIGMWLLIILTCQQLAVLTWRWWPGDTRQEASWRQPSAPAAVRSTDGLDLSALKRLGLFGKPDAPSASKPVTTEVPKTRLNVRLSGVLASSDPALSIAIIAQGGQQQSYGIDDTIQGTSATVRAILADRVIIQQQGQDETLMLDGEEYRSAAASHSSSRPALSQLRDTLVANPAKIMDYLTVAPVNDNGKLTGYRLNPAKDPELFAQLGLQPNDLAVSINGFDLRDMNEAMQIMQQLQTLTEANITVERDGQLQDIYVSLAE